jgi:C-6 monooxygenase
MRPEYDNAEALKFYSIIDYTVDAAETQRELAEAFEKIQKDWVRFYPGYLGAKILASTDGIRLYNIIEWRSEDDFRNFAKTSDTPGRLAAIGKALEGLSGKAVVRMTEAPHYGVLRTVKPGPAPSKEDGP